MSSSELVALIVLCLLAWFWLDSIKVREVGIRAARASCAREGVQLLDDTVAIRSLRLARDDAGHVRIRRAYDFEYSGSGDDRQRGSVILLGGEVVLLDLAEHRPPRFTVH